MSLENADTVVLTGAGGGLGVKLAEYLLGAGYRSLALVYRNRSDEVRALLQAQGLEPEQHLYRAELSNEEDVARLRKEIESKLGPAGSLVNLAGGSTNGLSWKLSGTEFTKVLNDNLFSTFLCCREFIPGMRERGNGRIINVSSIVASTGIAGASHYAAAKAGILGFTKSIAQELAPKGITANVLSLGYFNTGLIDHVNTELQNAIRERIPLKRFGTPEEIGGLLKFLLSPEGAYTTGQVIHINGGLYS